MSSFEHGAEIWIKRLGNLRNVVRQELIRRQLVLHVPAGASVLDIGCGQGTQAIELARRGCEVTAIEPAPALRKICAQHAEDAGVKIELAAGNFDNVVDVISGRRFDAVCAHGVFMYLPNTTEAIATMLEAAAPDALLSFTVRNGDAIAMRPGLRGCWEDALSSFGRLDYVNALGVSARAERLGDVLDIIGELGLILEAWYGVRALTDAAPVDKPPPTDLDQLAALLDAEEMACRVDPYRSMGSQYHLIVKNQVTTPG